MRRWFAAALLLVMAALAGCSGSDEPSGGQAEAEADAGGTSARFGFSGWSVGYLPTAIAIDRLAEEGYEIEVLELGGNSNQLQAAAQGEVDITAIAQVMDAMDQGLDSRFFLGGNLNEFVMVSSADLTTCESLDGRRVGIQSESSFVGQLTLQWMAAECPDAEPQITVIEGSENRLAALLQGQLDASPLDLQDWTLLQRERPDGFTITEDFTESIPVMRAAFAAPAEWLEANPGLAEAWVTTHLDVYQELYSNPDILVEKARELLPEVDPEALPDIVTAFVDAEVWPSDGDLSEESVQATIDFFNGDGEPFTSITGPADVVDRTYLDQALAAR